jgi:hypothetical protein
VRTYYHRGRVGVSFGCLGTLILAPLYAAVWVLVAVVYLVVLGVKAIAKARNSRRSGVR